MYMGRQAVLPLGIFYTKQNIDSMINDGIESNFWRSTCRVVSDYAEKNLLRFVDDQPYESRSCLDTDAASWFHFTPTTKKRKIDDIPGMNKKCKEK
jgi:hypothetical protein